MTTQIKAKPLFAATLVPPAALSAAAMRMVVLLVVVLALTPALLFSALGAWPVLGFAGLDVLGIVVALVVARRRSRVREVVSLWPNKLELRKLDAAGKMRVTIFAPPAVRLVLDRDFNERITALWLREGERRETLGDFLSGDEKLSFARAFGSALRQARRAG